MKEIWDVLMGEKPAPGRGVRVFILEGYCPMTPPPTATPTPTPFEPEDCLCEECRKEELGYGKSLVAPVAVVVLEEGLWSRISSKGRPIIPIAPKSKEGKAVVSGVENEK